MDELKKRVHAAFKLRGFILKSEVSLFLARSIENFASVDRDLWLTSIADNIQNAGLECTNVEITHIQNAMTELHMLGQEDSESIFSVIDAFHVPKYIYNPERMKFECVRKSTDFISNFDMKTKCLRQRYVMHYEKLARNNLLHSSNNRTIADQRKYKLYYIENMLSSYKVEEVLILGLLVQLTEGRFYIEDPTGSVLLDLSETQFNVGFLCEGCFIVAEGIYQEEVLKVFYLSFPPLETKETSKLYFELPNTSDPLSTNKNAARLLQLEKSNIDATIVFLSDVQLDNPFVMKKLKSLLLGYNSCPPVAIILMGPFMGNGNSIRTLKELFEELAEITNSCKQLIQKTELVLIPSLEDAIMPKILPLFPLPESAVYGLKQKWPRINLATNPCRLQYCSQEIVVCRVELFSKLCRNTIHFPDGERLHEDFARTLISQGTLIPLDSTTLPIYWEHESALSLYPLPDVIVVGDSSQRFSVRQQQCIILNTGSFIKSGFSFNVYVPSTKTVEDSEIFDNM